MQHVTLDFETAYGKGYSLRGMATHEYVRDSRFKIHGVGIKIEDNDAYWVTDNIANALHSINWTNSCLIGHNLYFDGSILFEHFNIAPARRVDTMFLAKGYLDRDQSVSLNNVASLLNLGHKIAGTLVETKDQWDLEPDLLERLGIYCLQDVNLTWDIYNKFIPQYPENELDLIDLTVRMGTNPVLEMNHTTALRALLEAENAQEDAIKKSGVPRTVLTSNKQFNEHLLSLGLPVPTKKSPRTGNTTPALGKNDPDFIRFMSNHPQHSDLWAGRLEASSSINVSRAKRWNYIATHGSRKMPMPYIYYGAHTGRFTGTDKINVQNLPKGSLLRKAITAPKDHVILVADSSQIELRMNAWFCGQEDVLDTLRKGKCVYSQMASQLTDRPADEIYKEKGNDRQFGKIVTLGCGYGMGATKFKNFCASGPLGMAPKYISDAEAQKTIQTYRTANHCIVDMWHYLQNEVMPALERSTQDSELMGLTIRTHRILLPNGMDLQYPDLHSPAYGKWEFGNNHPLWGGTLLENIIQALARIVITDQMLEVDKLDGVHVVGTTHDEILAVCHKDIAANSFDAIIDIMSTPPLWAKDVPLAAEGGWAENYSK